MRIYVAGPYSDGDRLDEAARVANVEAAMAVGARLLELGHVPFVPHLSHFWHQRWPQEYGRWMQWCTVWMCQCEAVVVVPGASSGAELEVGIARMVGIPCFWSVEDFLAWQSGRGDPAPVKVLERKEDDDGEARGEDGAGAAAVVHGARDVAGDPDGRALSAGERGEGLADLFRAADPAVHEP